MEELSVRRIERIKSVCDKVEKAQDAYKKIINDVYGLYSDKQAWKSDECKNFKTYMTKMFGMGSTTTTSLIAIAKVKNAIEDEYCNYGEVIEKFFMSRTMRQLLTFVKFQDCFKRIVDYAIEDFEDDAGADDLLSILSSRFEEVYENKDYLPLNPTEMIEEKQGEYEADESVTEREEQRCSSEDVKEEEEEEYTLGREQTLSVCELLNISFEEGLTITIKKRREMK